MAVTLTELAELRLRTFVRGTPDYTPEIGRASCRERV